MKPNPSALLKLCLGAAAICLSTVSYGNLINRGSFESTETIPGGNSWSKTAISETSPGHKDPFDPNDVDNSAAHFNSVGDGSPGILSQKVGGLFGTGIYILDFYASLTGGATLIVDFDGDVLRIRFEEVESDGFDPTGWTYYRYSFRGVDSPFPGVLTFSFGGAVGATGAIDDINVVCDEFDPDSTCTGGIQNVPEPGSLLLVGAALAGLGLVRRRQTIR